MNSKVERPLISIIIPTYNEEGRIARAITSMQNQTYRNLEIIVVDDWSTDNTKEIVERISKADSRVQYHALPFKPARRKNWRGYDINAGFSARNYGFKIAQGEWLTTQDADDASLLNRVETQYTLAKQYKATLVTIQWLQLKEDILDSALDTATIFKEKGEKNIVIKPEEIINIANSNKGILMKESFHRFIPFPIKWFPYTRKLFFRHMDAYPGADNSMLFNHKVRDSGFYFRQRRERTWGTPSGRGSGRDFAFRVALEFKNSWSFRLPMYLWNVNIENPDYSGYEKYLKK